MNANENEAKDALQKKKYHFKINDINYEWSNQYISGTDIRDLGSIPNNEDVFLLKNNQSDELLIRDNDQINLGQPGNERFVSKLRQYVIIVNAREKNWNELSITFQEIVILAFGSYDNNPNKGYTVTYSEGYEPIPEGTLVFDATVLVKNKMIFDVTATDKS